MSDHIPLILHMCTFRWSTLEIISLPPFVPNEHLFNHPEYKHLPKWEAYAEAVRDVMCHYSGLPKIQVDMKDFKAYNMKMLGKKAGGSWDARF